MIRDFEREIIVVAEGTVLCRERVRESDSSRTVSGYFFSDGLVGLESSGMFDSRIDAANAWIAWRTSPERAEQVRRVEPREPKRRRGAPRSA